MTGPVHTIDLAVYPTSDRMIVINQLRRELYPLGWKVTWPEFHCNSLSWARLLGPPLDDVAARIIRNSARKLLLVHIPNQGGIHSPN